MSLIVNSPFTCPSQHWVEGKLGNLELKHGRRPAGYEVFDTSNNTRRTQHLHQVNSIRSRVDGWRAEGYPGVTSISRRLLEHWHDGHGRQYPLYFCQLEAIETLIWWVEGAESFKEGIHVPGDGGLWERLCNKMATGAGKTTVMAMIITWQVLNALTYPKRSKDFSPAIFVVVPGLTVKARLQVLLPREGSTYDTFNLCPSPVLRKKLNQAEILVENWHTLMPLKDDNHSVVKKGPESDEAFTRRVLGRLSTYNNIIVINDEAHHAYRKPPEVKLSKKQAAEHGINLDEATRWIEGLDRIHKSRCIGRCFDLSATPFAPTGKSSAEVGLFDWIISDFGLNDAIEAGLVKIPRMVVRDDGLPDAKTLAPKLSNLYRDASVSQDLNRKKAKPHEPLPKLVKDAYTLLGADWRETAKNWDSLGHHCPPVMLTVCNGTETAARIEHYFNKGNAHWPELYSPGRTLRVDSKMLAKADMGQTQGKTANSHYKEQLKEIIGLLNLPETQKQQLLEKKPEDLLREIVDNVGKRGTAGQGLQNLISVMMLSEGWDAKNVTHIMGLRAFTSQLLCEQVVGRGLRRVSYDVDEHGMFLPEHVNVFGVPLSISETGEGGDTPPPPKPTTQISCVPDRAHLEIRWPNVLRIEDVVTPQLKIDWDNVQTLTLNPSETLMNATLAPALGGAMNMGKVTTINLEKLPEGFRLQRLVFQAAYKALANLKHSFSGTPEYLTAQLVHIATTFISSKYLSIPSQFYSNPLRRQILVALNIELVVEHIMNHITAHNITSRTPVFDQENPIGSTGQMQTWYTTKPCFATGKSQISHLLGDSSWEGYAANVFETCDDVRAYAKNDHLGFHIYYMCNGSRRRYVPDFLIRLANGHFLVLEIKGKDSAQNQAKYRALEEWVLAVNGAGGFGQWTWDVAFEPSHVKDILMKATTYLPMQKRLKT